MPTKPHGLPENVPRDRPLRILLVDDDRDDAVLFSHALKGVTVLHSELTVLHTYTEGLDHARRGAFDIHFVDLRLGIDSGLGLMTAVLEHEPRKSFVIFTGAGDERMAAEAMRKGAADYLPKASLNPDAVLECIANCYTLRESSTIEEQPEYPPAFDKQTDVYSHDLFLRASRNRIVANLGPGDHWCLMIVEVDMPRETHDKQESARILRLVAQTIRASLADTEPVGRCGPNRFCLLISCSGPEEGVQIAEQIRQEVERATPVTVSIGVAAMRSTVADLDKLFSQAVEAVSQATGDGQNGIYAI